jgi:hypothetical protein
MHPSLTPITERAWRSAISAQVSADMDGYQFLPTSHSIRAYLAVLYRL